MKYLIFLILFIFNTASGIPQTIKWKIIWDKNPENDIKEYIVYKNDEEKARVQSPDTVYIDTDIETGILYSYSIKAVNEKNVSSLFSDPAEAAIPGFKNMPSALGVSKDKPAKLFLRDFINDPNDSMHQIKRTKIPFDSKISVKLESGELIFTAHEYWTEQDTENVYIEVKDSREFYNVAVFTLKDESIVGGLGVISPQKLNIKVFPEEFSISQYNEIKISNIPQNSKIVIYDSFETLVYSEKDISNDFSWDAEDNNGDQVLFGLYNFVLYNKMNKILFESSFRVIP